jgi:hypothetical protein
LLTYDIVPLPDEDSPRILCADRLTGQCNVVFL